jgi:hypothetical protein
MESKIIGRLSFIFIRFCTRYFFSFKVITIQPTIANNNMIDVIINQIE